MQLTLHVHAVDITCDKMHLIMLGSQFPLVPDNQRSNTATIIGEFRHSTGLIQHRVDEEDCQWEKEDYRV